MCRVVEGQLEVVCTVQSSNAVLSKVTFSRECHNFLDKGTDLSEISMMSSDVLLNDIVISLALTPANL